MSDTVLAAIVGAVAGIITGSIGSLFAPWANWGIEKRKQKLAYQRELVIKWRAMIEEVAHKNSLPDEDENYAPVDYSIDRHRDFYSLKPHLKKTLGRDSGEPWSDDGELKILIDEVARIEKEWGLI
jgi:hypothetical protein